MGYTKFVTCLLLSLICLGQQIEAKSIFDKVRPVEFLDVSNQEQFEQLKQKAALSKKSLFIAFLGSSWCPWSIKMEEEIFSHQNLLASLEEECLLVKIFVPAQASDDPSYIALSDLARQFDVKESPTFVLLSSEGEVITKEGFFPLPAEQFVAHWKECFQEFKEISSKLQDQSFAHTESGLEQMYQKAKSLSFHSLHKDIITQGMMLAKEPFFFLERYEDLAAEKKFKDPALQDLRKKICTLDPKNEKRAHLRLALIDFSAQQGKKKNRRDPKLAVEPLLSYIKDFGKTDPENLWKLEMMVAQFLFSKGKYEIAIKHAERSLDASPESVREDIAQTLSYLKEAAEKKSKL